MGIVKTFEATGGVAVFMAIWVWILVKIADKAR